ncbi:MAG TPA: ABC transporter substrate-binding protein [Acidobacteriaceae bacterium]|nr:ABC transporter substrate-binding protein [Acidobacteriaceae bacterium]
MLSLAGCHQSPDKGTAVMLIESSPNDLDLRIGTDAQSEHIGALIFDSLVHKDQNFDLQPWLAESWQQNDPVTWTFHIRHGVRFHNGQPLTAADIVWTLNSMRDGTLLTPRAGLFASIDHVEATDGYTVVIHLKHPDSALLFNLSDGSIGIVPHGSGDMGQHPIGTGPFRFVSQTPDKEIVLERNPDWWQTPPAIQTLRFNVVPDTITRALELQRGSADAALNALTADMVESLRHDPNLVIESSPGAELSYINFNTADPVLKNISVRQAINCAIDRPLIIRTLWRGQARIANSILPQSEWAYYDASSSAACSRFDPEHAKQLLDAAGFPAAANGIRLRLTMKTSTDESSRLFAAIAQQQLRAVGIQLDLRSSEFASFYSDVTHGAFQMYPLRWVGGNEDPDIFRLVFASSSAPPHGYNRGRYSNPLVDSLIATANASTDQAARKAAYVQIQQQLATDMPSINLWYLDTVLVHSHRLTNVQPSPSADYFFLVNARLQ